MVGERGCGGSSSARVEDPEGDDESVVGGEEDGRVKKRKMILVGPAVDEADGRTVSLLGDSLASNLNVASVGVCLTD